jgi:hypothetical protein
LGGVLLVTQQVFGLGVLIVANNSNPGDPAGTGGIMLYWIFYTDNLPIGTGGCANGPVIRIRPRYKASGDLGIKAHEICHTEQWWKGGLLIHSLRYKFSKAYRLACEVQAYKEQLRWPPAVDHKPEYQALYAQYISEDYGLSITVSEAFKLLDQGGRECGSSR